VWVLVVVDSARKKQQYHHRHNTGVLQLCVEANETGIISIKLLNKIYLKKRDGNTSIKVKST
jgi:hypothetical protein